MVENTEEILKDSKTKNKKGSTKENKQSVDEVQEETEAINDLEESHENDKDSKDLKIEELSDKLIRSVAEFENFRKRSEKEKANMFSMGAKTIIEVILPVIDNFERGLTSIAEEEKESGFAQGIDMIYKQLMSVLEGVGVKPIEAVGKPFDPDFHNAIMHEESDEYDDNIVIEEFLKGYTYNDVVVRYSTVKVVN